jgi:hypothetical protein
VSARRPSFRASRTSRAGRARLSLVAGLALAASTAGCPTTSLEDPGRFDAGEGSLGNSAAGGGSGEGGAAAIGIGEGGACPDLPQFFAATCTASSCHNASDEAQGLDLQSPDVASRLVGVMATEGSGLLVDPSSPGASILYLKLMAHPPFGAQMPLGQPPLSAAMTGCVLDWIQAGETDDPGAAAIDAAAPADGEAPGPPGPNAGYSCETTMDGAGNAQCSCLAGTAPSANAVASCAGYDCCVRYAADSGLMEGFGNPSLSSNLCACYSAAGIAAIYGATITCQRFASGAGATIVKSCP